MNNQGYPIPITAKEVFTFLDQLMAYNGRTPDGMDKALVLEQVDGRAHSFFEAYPSLRYVTTDEDDEEADQKPLLVYDAAWNPKVSEGREKCLEWDKTYILPALRAQFTSNKTKTENGIGAGHAQRRQADEGGTNRLGNYANARQGVPRTA